MRVNKEIKEIKEIKENIPALRFKGCFEEWEEDKFGNLVLIQRGGSPRPIEEFLTQDANGINWIKIGDVSSESRYINKTKEKIKPEGASSSRWVYKGDLILSNSMSFGRPYIMNIDGCIHDGWLLIRNDKNIFYLEFLLQLLSSNKMLSQYQELASGGVVNNLNSALVQSTRIIYPNKEEQKKVGKLFKTLDKNITQHQAEIDELNKIKQIMLRKMFPQGNATEPEIRFKGFSKNWVQCELAEICNIIGGGTPSTAISEYWNGNINWYSPTEIGKTVYAYSSVKKITAKGFENSSARMLPANRTILFTSRAGIGDMAILKYEGCTNQGFQSLVLNDEIDTYFIYSMGFLIKEYALKHASGSTFLEISNKQLGKMPLYLPSKNEQQKIGKYFQKLDQLINLKNNQLNKLKQIKKTCLTKMFV